MQEVMSKKGDERLDKTIGELSKGRLLISTLTQHLVECCTTKSGKPKNYRRSFEKALREALFLTQKNISNTYFVRHDPEIDWVVYQEDQRDLSGIGGWLENKLTVFVNIEPQLHNTDDGTIIVDAVVKEVKRHQEPIEQMLRMCMTFRDHRDKIRETLQKQAESLLKLNKEINNTLEFMPYEIRRMYFDPYSGIGSTSDLLRYLLNRKAFVREF